MYTNIPIVSYFSLDTRISNFMRYKWDKNKEYELNQPTMSSTHMIRTNKCCFCFSEGDVMI